MEGMEGRNGSDRSVDRSNEEWKEDLKLNMEWNDRIFI